MSIEDGLIRYLMLVSLLTFHEYGHAWVAMKCGDDTALRLGRVSLNPLVHMDILGTVILPLSMIFLPFGVSRFLIGWAKPVPVNPANFRYPDRDDLLITLAGPGMNLLLGIVIIGSARVLDHFGVAEVADLLLSMAHLSLLLCFFNLLLPIPPLDGSRVVRVLVGMSHENYAKLAQFSFIPLIIILQFQPVRDFISATTTLVYLLIFKCFYFQ